MTLCYPPGADWTVGYTADQLAEMRADPATLAKMKDAEALAWMSLATLSADRIGTCPITVRPCAAGCSAAGTWTEAPAGYFMPSLAGRSSFYPHINAQGAWVNSCGCSATDCGCSALSTAILPGPVGQIVEVWLDGAIVDPATYRVDNGNQLVSLDPDRPWPSCQNLMQDAHGADAFSVTYYRGAAPDGLVLMAAGTMSVEWYKRLTGAKGCRLPAGTQNITRQGVSYEIQADFFEDGRTGIPEVDALIARLNPFHLKMRPVIASPDTRRTRVM